MTTPFYAIEVATDPDKQLLWVERYVYSRSHSPGETFIRDSQLYRVLAVAVSTTQSGLVLVKHTIRPAD